MYVDRKALISELEKARNSKVLLYVTGDRPGWETQISSEAFDPFVDHLDTIGVVERISLVLYTRGGDTLAGWSLVNLIRQFCREFEVIIPHKCHSAGTLIALGANRIVMTKQATLGPIDPSVNTPLNPHVEGAPPDSRVSVSVEGIQGFITLAREELGIKDEVGLSEVLVELSKQVHPLVLGQVIRARGQIQMLARRLIVNQVTDEKKIEEVVSFLTSESGSHDYTISRREGRDLGLHIESPDDGLYLRVKALYDDFRNELRLNQAFDSEAYLGQDQSKDYEVKRVIAESLDGGSDYFQSEGTLSRVTVNTPAGPQTGINDTRNFEGWRRQQ
ncbi:MAG: serine protease [Gammaproteobacteria bacterium]|nr:serine protease [Gammaproteobacteria bacterium]